MKSASLIIHIPNVSLFLYVDLRKFNFFFEKTLFGKNEKLFYEIEIFAINSRNESRKALLLPLKYFSTTS